MKSNDSLKQFCFLLIHRKKQKRTGLKDIDTLASATGEATVAKTALEIEASQAEQKIISNLKRPDETKVEFMRHLLNIVDMHPEGFINGHFSAQKKEQDLADPRPTDAPDKLVEEDVEASDVHKSDGFDEIERLNINLHNLRKFL